MSGADIRHKLSQAGTEAQWHRAPAGSILHCAAARTSSARGCRVRVSHVLVSSHVLRCGVWLCLSHTQIRQQRLSITARTRGDLLPPHHLGCAALGDTQCGGSAVDGPAAEMSLHTGDRSTTCGPGEVKMPGT